VSRGVRALGWLGARWWETAGVWVEASESPFGRAGRAGCVVRRSRAQSSVRPSFTAAGGSEAIDNSRASLEDRGVPGRGASWAGRVMPVAPAIERVDQCVAFGRPLLERLDDHPLDLLIADTARLAGPRLVVQPVKPTARKRPRHLPTRLARSPAARRSPCSARHRRPPTRSGNAAQEPASSSAGEPNAPAPPAPPRLSTISTRCGGRGVQSSAMTPMDFATKPPVPAD
jgi:hypothetical protein